MGAGKTTLGAEAARLIGRRFVDLDAEIERVAGADVTSVFAEHGEAGFRELETRVALDVLGDGTPAVVALGGGAVTTPEVRRALRQRALTVWLPVEPAEAWRRVEGSGRPLAQDAEEFEARYRRRLPLYHEVADAVAADADDVVLAAGRVYVGTGLTARLPEILGGDGAAALVADEHVLALHGDSVRGALGDRLASTHTLPRGEAAKSLDVCARLWDELELERGGVVVALGGGTTTDVAGFAAATYLRGVAWAPVPTTLVGQVDAAIGGKTGIDLRHGKNLVGAFHWPAATVIDPALLETLPEHERANGRAEVVKTGLLAGQPLWELPEEEQVRRCAAFKTAVCLRDPFERGPRAQLNLGHTFAHALEAAAGYELPHGEAVALGLLAATRLSCEMFSLAPEIPREVERLLAPRPVAVDREAAWAALRRDKKTAGGRTRLVLLEDIGRPLLGVELPDDTVRRVLDSLIA